MSDNRTDLTQPEIEVDAALTTYKVALIKTNHRSKWHRFMCWMGEASAMRADSELDAVTRQVKEVVNRTPDHKRALRCIAARQPANVREQDCFLALLTN